MNNTKMEIVDLRVILSPKELEIMTNLTESMAIAEDSLGDHDMLGALVALAYSSRITQILKNILYLHKADETEKPCNKKRKAFLTQVEKILSQASGISGYFASIFMKEDKEGTMRGPENKTIH